MASNDKSIELQASIWMTVDGSKFGGQDRIALLAQIAEQGSITRAAKAVGLSYKAAWDAIDAMNDLAAEPLVQRSTGGKGGGGSRLTPRGRRLVDNFRTIEREHQRFMTTLSEQADHLADDYLLIRRMSMKTSARNQFLGKVTSVVQGAVNDEVELEMNGGQRIVATITRESATNLGLKPGVEAFALVKASSVIVLTDDAGARFSARNRLNGTVARVQPGAVDTEVVIDLANGLSVAAIVTNESNQSLELAVGKPASALFKASSVIIGMPA
ncbi:MAG: TOBE domain-containing protein [Lautropia sp.]|nr:TOBE domain-containing protein [Lautropia sp.]